MPHILFRKEERGLKDIGWLRSHFTFSFSSYSNPLRNGFGLLKAFNDDFVQPGNGFGLHPHQNMEIISVMLQGRMNHIDSMGYKEVVEKDWVQLMSAGSGLRHEEHNVGEEEVNFLQIWIEPKLQNINPRYQKRYFPAEKRQNRLVTIVSNEEGIGHCWINQNAQIQLGKFDAGQNCSLELNPLNKSVFILCISGSLEVNGRPIGHRDAIGFWETSSISIRTLSDAEYIVIETPINH